jgi:hypothetical protein
MVKCLSALLDFIYIARQNSIDEDDLANMEDALERFHEHCKVFSEEGVCSDVISLPRQHSLVHYVRNIRLFGAPNGLCSSITEAKHIVAVKQPWRRSSRYKALSQMLLTNQRMDKMAAARVYFEQRGMLVGTALSYTAQELAGALDEPASDNARWGDALAAADDDDGAPVSGWREESEVALAARRGKLRSLTGELWLIKLLQSVAIHGISPTSLSTSVVQNSPCLFNTSSGLTSTRILMSMLSMSLLPTCHVSTRLAKSMSSTRLWRPFTHPAMSVVLEACAVNGYGVTPIGADSIRATTPSLFPWEATTMRPCAAWLLAESSSFSPCVTAMCYFPWHLFIGSAQRMSSHTQTPGFGLSALSTLPDGRHWQWCRLTPSHAPHTLCQSTAVLFYRTTFILLGLWTLFILIL